MSTKVKLLVELNLYQRNHDVLAYRVVKEAVCEGPGYGSSYILNCWYGNLGNLPSGPQYCQAVCKHTPISKRMQMLIPWDSTLHHVLYTHTHTHKYISHTNISSQLLGLHIKLLLLDSRH
jgi:hypothetical protein